MVVTSMMKYKFVHVSRESQALFPFSPLRIKYAITYAAVLMKFFLFVCAFGVLFMTM